MTYASAYTVVTLCIRTGLNRSASLLCCKYCILANQGVFGLRNEVSGMEWVDPSPPHFSQANNLVYTWGMSWFYQNSWDELMMHHLMKHGVAPQTKHIINCQDDPTSSIPLLPCSPLPPLMILSVLLSWKSLFLFFPVLLCLPCSSQLKISAAKKVCAYRLLCLQGCMRHHHVWMSGPLIFGFCVFILFRKRSPTIDKSLS